MKIPVHSNELDNTNMFWESTNRDLERYEYKSMAAWNGKNYIKKSNSWFAKWAAVMTSAVHRVLILYDLLTLSVSHFLYLELCLSVGPVGSSLPAGSEWKSSLVHPWCSPSCRRAHSLYRPLSPALLGGLRPTQGPLCDVGCPIKDNPIAGFPGPSPPWVFIFHSIDRRWGLPEN